MRSAELPYWLAAIHLPKIAPYKFLAWVDYFDGIINLFHAQEADWRAAGLTTKMIAALRAPDWAQVDKALAWQSEVQHLIPITDAEYPPQLKEIADPPLLLYVQGNKAALHQSQLAIVGSRHASLYGCSLALNFARHLASAGLVITSGLAAGIDQAGHKGVLEAKGITIGVAGTGLNYIYPASNKNLVHAILNQNGAILSEFPLDTRPERYHFPQRNRIISGLSLGVLVVEAALKSGSLVTARHALEQGREVFAIPGAITQPLARGCHHLIRQGATLIEKAEDILEQLHPGAQFVPKILSDGALLRMTDLSTDYIKVLQLITYEITPIDVILLRAGLTAVEVSSILLNLELQGYILATAGGYIRVAINETT